MSHFKNKQQIWIIAESTTQKEINILWKGMKYQIRQRLTTKLKHIQ